MRKWYTESARYWSKVPATVDGVLGGYGHISDIDIDGSKALLEKVFALENPPDTKRALDCGAGIGRVTKHLLIPRFDKVDLVEQDEKFINAANQFIGEDNTKLGKLYQISILNFKFEKYYDVIWCQWVLGHLDDLDFIDFLKNCVEGLTSNGVIVIKENITHSGELEFDDDDSSVTRPMDLMLDLFNDAKLKLVLTDTQKGFPDDIYPVQSFVLVPFFPSRSKAVLAAYNYIDSTS